MYPTIPMAIRNLAFVQIVIGAILVIIDIAAFATSGYHYGYYEGWRGFSGGAVMIITGIFGVLATRGSTLPGERADRRCLLITTMILSIIVAINSLVQFIWVASIIDRQWRVSDMALGIITVVLFVIAVVASIAQAVYTGRVLNG
ncbi:uncharacterized protein LOC129588331 isoform X2 [Paramacrobiotus metropolitanus]|uniref:uncharacterized protein LOC129588331 isoform X2 n=1 Tax=Paramacrobiotus metropolitanus TaxID=2943436 RepID=UPI0024460D1D|nr:uncharacterized protein LOC129588331 isoform X2 [Paramacrobiotus metropolitanus]